MSTRVQPAPPEARPPSEAFKLRVCEHFEPYRTRGCFVAARVEEFQRFHYEYLWNELARARAGAPSSGIPAVGDDLYESLEREILAMLPGRLSLGQRVKLWTWLALGALLLLPALVALYGGAQLILFFMVLQDVCHAPSRFELVIPIVMAVIATAFIALVTRKNVTLLGLFAETFGRLYFWLILLPLLQVLEAWPQYPATVLQAAWVAERSQVYAARARATLTINECHNPAFDTLEVPLMAHAMFRFGRPLPFAHWKTVVYFTVHYIGASIAAFAVLPTLVFSSR